MTQPALMNSGYKRLKDDNYQTIDKRCIWAFLEHFKPTSVIDPCAPSGSGIVDALKEKGYEAYGMPDADGGPWYVDWIASNPPYDRKKKIGDQPQVDWIIYRQIDRLTRGEVNGVAMLMRWNFDFAISRRPMFADNPYYYGKIQMLFRPRWFEKKKDKKNKNPFHPYVWHIWTNWKTIQQPVIMYSNGDEK